jgi:hypothetical protein
MNQSDKTTPPLPGGGSWRYDAAARQWIASDAPAAPEQPAPAPASTTPATPEE